MYEVVQVRLREAGKITYYSTSGMKFKTGDHVIVEADRGLDYGQVLSETEVVLDADLEEPLKKIIRKSNPWDLHQIEKNKTKIKEVMTTCSKKIQERKLPMKLVDAEFSFDRSKIVFYFTAEGRIDFRDLVKDLANAFKARIELKQIGVRDEAKMLGGFGPCGRALCCATYLKDFEPVTIKMAKEQNLPLNPTKISGLCGRLMCCLGYEYKTYKDLMKGLPREGETVKTEKGPGKVLSINAIKRSAMVELGDGTQLEVFYKESKTSK
ncbi:MAG: stage 0 sporulation family protein [Candidatus Omnitrophica bacterium]|nr:stage 0 sporulation family protein [Candidatus Omnitrophota bacterium]